MKIRTERRRRDLADHWGLPETATWKDLYAASRESRQKVDKHHAATSEERRQLVGIACRLSPDATWDQIYAHWKRKWGYGTLMTDAIGVAWILPAFILLISTHWVGVALSVLVFVVVVIGIIIQHRSAIVDEYWGHVIKHPEIFVRAKRDGFYD
ncbi:MAG: hypothetical protein ACR2OY_10655 [Boseongicola sp.]